MKFRDDHPFIRLLSWMGSLIWVNVLTTLCCLPIVTAGAALTAAHFACLRIVRDDDYGLTKVFFQSFKQNFRQATLIWLLLLATGAFLIGDVYFMNMEILQVPLIAQILIYLVCGLWACLAITVFPVLARFENTIGGTLKNSMALSLMRLPKTLLGIAASVLPFVLVFLKPTLLPIPLFFGFSAPIWLQALMYSKLFLHLEAENGGSEDTLMAEEAAQEENEF